MRKQHKRTLGENALTREILQGCRNDKVEEERLCEKLSNPDFEELRKYGHGLHWEEHINADIAKIWSHLSSETKLALYLMAMKLEEISHTAIEQEH